MINIMHFLLKEN